MRSAYTFAVDDSVLQAFAQSKPRDRLDLLKIFQHLADHPSLPGDHVRKTATFRETQVKRFGKWLVTWWPDHAVSELRIIDLERLTG